jgi:hypothetical protein
VTAEHLRDLVWYLAFAFGWVSMISLGCSWYARQRFQAFLKVPLTEEAEHLTHVWERRVTRWTRIGLSLAGLSILCLASWLIAGGLP